MCYLLFKFCLNEEKCALCLKFRLMSRTHMIYMNTLLSRVLYISYRNLLVIDSAGAKWMNTFANQWLSLLKL